MTTGSKLHPAHHLRSSRRFHDAVGRLGKLPVALTATERLRTSSLRPQIANLKHPGTARRRNTNASPSHTPRLKDSKLDSRRNLPPTPAVDWWTRLDAAILAVNALAQRDSVTAGHSRVLVQSLYLQSIGTGGERSRQSSPMKVVALTFPGSRLVESQASVLRLAVLNRTNSSLLPEADASNAAFAAKDRSGLDAPFVKLRERVAAFIRAVSNFFEIVVQSSSLPGFISSFPSSVASRQRQASRIGDAVEKTLSRSTAGDLDNRHIQSGLITLQRAAVIATLAAPLLAAPALASIPAARRASGDTSCIPSIVINSTPTVVVNSSQSSEIERQVLEALRQHRDALYEQWHREVRRRQRTEF